MKNVYASMEKWAIFRNTGPFYDPWGDNEADAL